MSRRRVTASVNMWGTRRLTIADEPTFEGSPREEHGIIQKGLYIGRKYVVAHTYSIWDRGDGRVRGDGYTLCDRNDLGWIRRVYGTEAAERASMVLR